MKKNIFVIVLICFWMAFVNASHAFTTVTVSAEKEQKVTGFGAAALWHLMAPMADANIINYLYGEDSPVGLNIMRMEIAPVSKAGAWDQWTYNSWDKYLPAVKAAKAKGAIVFATPWSPPGEMKTNGSASGGLESGVKVKNGMLRVQSTI